MFLWRLMIVFSVLVMFCARDGSSFHSRHYDRMIRRGSKMFHTSTAQVLSEANSRQAQILSFTEPTTNTTVILVGSMHYNPRSIELAKSTIEEYAEKDELASVIIESCEVRWRKTLDLLSPTIPTNENLLQSLRKQWKIFSKEKLFYNEMYAAEETAKRYDIPVILGDQLINQTSASIEKGLKQTIKDLIQPFQGWERIKQDFQSTYPIAMPSGEGYLGIQDYLNLQLLLSTPVTLFRYPLSIALRAPLLLLPIFISALTLVLPGYLPTPDILAPLADPLTDSTSAIEPFTNVLAFILGTVVLPLLEFVILGRIFLIHILAERNVVIAEKILQQCQLITNVKDQGERPSNITQLLNMKLFERFLPEQMRSLFVGNQIRDNEKDEASEGNSQYKTSSSRKVVIAVLGMAHCNGIKKLLTSSMVQASSSPPAIVKFDKIIQ